MNDSSALIAPVDVAVCDPDVLWRVERMNAVKGVNVREYASAADALDVITAGHPTVVVIGPTSTQEELDAVAARGPKADWVRLLVVASSDGEEGIAQAETFGVDRLLPPLTEDDAFAAAVHELLRGADGSGDSESLLSTEIDSESEVPSGRRSGERRASPYQHVIVPFDGTAAAQGATMVGADIARLIGAELVVMTANSIDRPAAIRQMKERAIDMSDASVTIWQEPTANETKAIKTMVGFRPNSLICMSSSARTGVRRAVYGSLAERLVRTLDGPLLLVGPRWTGASVADLHHLVVCVDDTDKAEAAVELAAAWATAVPVNVTLLHIDTGPDDAPVDLDRLAGPLEGLCDIVDKVTVENPDAVEGILEVVEAATSPFVVLATAARTGVDRALHGSTMAALIKSCPVPVLVQRGSA